MPTRIVINGKEVESPLAKALVGFVTFAVLAALASVFVFLFLPLVGIAVTMAVGIVIVILIALVFALPLLLLWGALIGAILTPFAAMRGDTRRNSRGRLPPPD
ncbi:MAG TPA: hypothetical protein VIT83_00310 [Gammaproteobacteria bacterium]